ncbi:MAG TPA: hypothetical protein DHV12_03650 [Thermotogae bacterium]|nr:polar amino acid transport system substrate-binding protein [Thermotogota bacterium]HCZ06219.1 hypothetical protein [Thermotogota bacterium]
MKKIIESGSFIFWLLESVVLAFVLFMGWLFAGKAFRKKVEQLKLMNKKLLAELEESKHLRKQLEITNRRFSKVLELSSQLSDPNVSLEDYFENVLSFSIELIPSAEKGSIFLKDDSKWAIVAAVGYSKEEIASLELNVANFFAPSKPSITKSLKEWHKDHNSSEVFSSWSKIFGNVRETLIVPLKDDGNIFGMVNLDISQERADHFNDEDILMAQRFAKMVSVFHLLREHAKREGRLHNKVALTIAKALEYYDTYTRGHSERVAKYTSLLAERLNLPRETVKRLYWAGLLHDIGKIFIPQAVLNKPGKLDEEEYELVKIHPLKSEELIRELEGMEDIALWVRHHHERWDGKGYPDGLSNGDIPLPSRILAVVDSYDAMITERPYRKALTRQGAIQELRENSLKQFDPQVVEVAITLFESE